MADGRAEVYALLLAGGSGTRMWPVSRKLYPKQLVSFLGSDSLVQNTVKRLHPLIAADRVRVVCGREHAAETERHLRQVGIFHERCIIGEPCGRNTAPAILLAVLRIRGEATADPVVCVFPADHVIRDIGAFHEKIATAVKLAEKGHIVTFGIQPTYPETGYGYIEAGDAVGHGGHRVRRFVEKPHRELAQQYLQSGNFYWNSGMFAFRVAVICEAYARLQPELYEQMSALVAKGEVSLEDYAQLSDISIDYAIMEKTDNCVVVPSDFGWSDIGSWKSLYDYCEKDERGNVISGDVMANETENCFILSHHRLVAANYLRGLVIVETPDTVFVSDLENSREVKTIVERLKAEGRREFREHRTVYHHWGSTSELDRRPGCTVERLEIYAEARLDLTVEEPRAHLYVCGGEISVRQAHTQSVVSKGNGCRLATGQTAQITNLGKDAAALIVVRSGKHSS